MRMVLPLAYRLVCVRENRKRDGSGTLEGFDHAYEDDLTDKLVRTPEAHLIPFDSD